MVLRDACERLPGPTMSGRWVFLGVGVLAMLAGTGLWLATRAPPVVGAPRIDGAAVLASTFQRIDATPESLGQFAGQPIVLNFWATWCAPCRAEMPAFDRLQERMGRARVRFVGLSRDDPSRVKRFLAEVPVSYPLLVGGPEVDALASALGNRVGVLPFTVVLDGDGHVIAQHVGAYSTDALTQAIERASHPTPAK